MPVRSTSIFAILGMLEIKPMSAYELLKFSKNSIGFFWNESYGNLHATLKKLEHIGWINALDNAPKRRNKKTYILNTTGQKQLKEWILQPPHDSILRDELLLKVFLSQKEEISHIRKFIQNTAQEMKQALMILNEIQKGIEQLDHDPVHKQMWLLTLDYGKRYAQMRSAWCQDANNKLVQLERDLE